MRGLAILFGLAAVACGDTGSGATAGQPCDVLGEKTCGNAGHQLHCERRVWVAYECSGGCLDGACSLEGATRADLGMACLYEKRLSDDDPVTFCGEGLALVVTCREDGAVGMYRDCDALTELHEVPFACDPDDEFWPSCIAVD